jgi:hypothetical protein
MFRREPTAELERFQKSQVLDAHEEGVEVAVRLATEAVEALGRGVNNE